MKGLDDIGRMGAVTVPQRLHGISVARWFVIFPLLLFSLLTPGTMLERDAGGVTVVLCVSGTPVQVVIAADGSVQEKSGHAGQHGCDWALHAQPAMAQSLAVADLPAMMPVPLRFSRARPDHSLRMDVLAPLARGPPDLA